MTVHYVPYSQIAPLFGKQEGDEIFIRDDLPEDALNFVLAHETFHVTEIHRPTGYGANYGQIWRESGQTGKASSSSCE